MERTHSRCRNFHVAARNFLFYIRGASWVFGYHQPCNRDTDCGAAKRRCTARNSSRSRGREGKCIKPVSQRALSADTEATESESEHHSRAVAAALLEYNPRVGRVRPCRAGITWPDNPPTKHTNRHEISLIPLRRRCCSFAPSYLLTLAFFE